MVNYLPIRIERIRNISVEETEDAKEMELEEVGKEVGIPQLYNFSKWFKTITGTTPYQYKKANTSK